MTVAIWGRQPPLRHQLLPARTGILVVGGGITGVSLLHWLSRAGLDAVLLERHHLAAGASGRNAGFVLTGVTANYAQAARTYGREQARQVWQFTIENHARLTHALAGHQVGYRRHGSWTVAGTHAEAEALQQAGELLREDALPGSWTEALPPPLSDYPGGLLNPDDCELDPVALVGAIASLAGARRIHEGVAVTGIEASSGSVRVHTAERETVAETVILATNAYTTQLFPKVPITPVRGQMLATAPAAARVAERPVYAHMGFRYWRQLPDGELLVGGFRDWAIEEEVGFDERPTPRIQTHLDQHLRSLGVSAAATHRWAGVMGFTPDCLPLVGALPGHPNVYICAGYSGHGLGFAFLAGRRLSDLLHHGTPVPGWMEPARFA